MGTLATRNAGEIAATQPGPMGEAIEAALAQGDLAKLSVPQRIEWYKHRCAAAGLNPASRPFEYITLQGKLTLYATKACTDQLSGIHGLSHEILSRETVEGLHVVTVRIRSRAGRTTEDIGAVPVQGLRGPDLANALMKAVTKAKRRATLSICGLGDVVDESELDTIADARICDDRGSLIPPNNNSGHGRGQYASPSHVREYMQAMETYVAKRNAAWLDTWAEADGSIKEGVKDLCNIWQADNHLAKWAKETGRLDANSFDERGVKNRQIGLYTAIVYHRSKDDRRALTKELARYLDEKESRAREAITLSIEGPDKAEETQEAATDNADPFDDLTDDNWEPGANG